MEKQPQKAGEVFQLDGDGSRQLVAGESQLQKAGEVAQFGRNSPRQFVVKEIQPLKAGEVAQFGRNSPRQLVVKEIQPLKAGEVAQLGRDSSRQFVVGEIQPRDAAVAVNADAVPVRQRRRTQPVRVGCPVGPPGGVVERLQYISVPGRTRERGSFVAQGDHGRTFGLAPDGGLDNDVLIALGQTVGQCSEGQCRGPARRVGRDGDAPGSADRVSVVPPHAGRRCRPAQSQLHRGGAADRRPRGRHRDGGGADALHQTGGVDRQPDRGRAIRALDSSDTVEPSLEGRVRLSAQAGVQIEVEGH